MKNWYWFLFFSSVALNAVGLWALFSPAAPAAQPPNDTSASVAAVAPSPPEKSEWARVQADSLPELMTNLQETHCPPDVLAAIVAAQVRQIYDGRRREAIPPSTKEFWKNMSFDITEHQVRRQLVREQRDELRRLLGDQADALNPLGLLIDQYQYGLPETKVAEAKRIMEDYNELRADLSAVNFGTFSLSSESGAQYMAIEKAMRAELGSILSPEERERFDLYSSQTAYNLRMRSAAFSPSEEEFRLIFQKRFALDQQLGSNPRTPEEMNQRTAAEKALTEEIKAALGPERGAEYERSNDYGHVLTSQLAARLQLPPTTAAQAWNLQKDITERAQALFRNSQLPHNQRLAQIATLRQEATNQLTSLFGGEQGFQLYKQYGGQWLRMLEAFGARPN